MLPRDILTSDGPFPPLLAPQYAVGDEVKLWVNKVGPYNNPQETYNYYTLPFCKPNPDAKPEHRWGGLGEVLEGNELINSQIDIRFRREPPLPLCPNLAFSSMVHVVGPSAETAR